MSAPVSSAEVVEVVPPVRFARTRARPRRPGRRRHPGLAVRELRPHAHQHRHLLPPPLRPGVPRRLVAAPPRQREHVRDPRLGADPVALGDRDGQDRGLVRAGRRGLAVGVPRDRALPGPLRRVPRPRGAPGRSGGDRDRPLRDAERAVDAAAGGQLPAGRGRGRRLAAHAPRRPGPLVADPPRLAVGDAPRDVAGRPGDRGRGGGRPGARPRSPGAAAAGRRGAGGLGGRRRSHARRPEALHRGRGGRVALGLLRRVGVAGLDERVRRHRRGTARASPSSPCGGAGTTTGPRSSSSRWLPPSRSTRNGRSRSRPP